MKKAIIVIAAGFVLTILSAVPFLSLLIGIITIPLFLIFPAMAKSGLLVEFWFFGFFPIHPYAWLILFSYYSLLCLLIYTLREKIKEGAKK